MYDKAIELVTRHLAESFGPAAPRIAAVLVLTTNAGAGDAFAHLSVEKMPRDKLITWLGAYFPTFAVKTAFTPLGILSELLEHRTGNPAVDRVLEACDKASQVGDGAIGRWLE